MEPKGLGNDEQGIAIAVIDDDHSVRRALARLLRTCGLSVALYASAEDFLASHDVRTYALLVVDVAMADMSGLDLLESLAASGRYPQAIVLTAHATETTRERARRYGAPILSKPFESAELLAVVGEAIGRDLDRRVA